MQSDRLGESSPRNAVLVVFTTLVESLLSHSARCSQITVYCRSCHVYRSPIASVYKICRNERRIHAVIKADKSSSFSTQQYTMPRSSCLFNCHKQVRQFLLNLITCFAVRLQPERGKRSSVRFFPQKRPIRIICMP